MAIYLQKSESKKSLQSGFWSKIGGGGMPNFSVFEYTPPSPANFEFESLI